MASLHEMSMLNRRFEIEYVNERGFIRRMLGCTRDLRLRGATDGTSLGEDLPSAIERELDELKSHVEVLSSWFSDQINLFNMKASHNLQVLLLVLTVFLATLAALQVFLGLNLEGNETSVVEVLKAALHDEHAWLVAVRRI